MKWACGSALCLIVAISTAGRALATVPAHYLIFEVEGQSLTPVFHREVELSALPQLAREQGLRRLQSFSVLDADGELEFEGTVEVLLSRQPESPGLARGAASVLARSQVVVRVPLVPGGRLVFGPPSGAAFLLDDLESLSGSTDLESLADSARPGLLDAWGDPGNRLDVVIVAEGFREEEEGEFQQAAVRAAEALFAVSPHSEYRNFVNVATVFVPSLESGADHPAYAAGCDSPECCPDLRSRGDPRGGRFVDTPLDATYCVQGLFRYLRVDEAKLLAAASAYPDWDQLLVLVNDTTYGGSGDSVTVVSLAAAMNYLVPHEFSHTFTRLTDEYDSFFSWPPCSDLFGPPCEANVTDETVRSSIKWEPWIDRETPVPTPETGAYRDLLGLFQGARYLETGMYRPTDSSCMMNTVSLGYCPICRQEYVLELYRGAWGSPAGGIDLIEPGSELPTEADLRIEIGERVDFSVDVLQPVGGARLLVSWLVDGLPVADAIGPTFRFSPPHAGRYEVEAIVEDPVSFVHPEMAGDLLTSSRRWVVEAAENGCVGDVTALCLNDRFRLAISWEAPNGSRGVGRVAAPRSRDSGLFYFFQPENWEVLTKVVDGCALNQHWWFFLAATTNVGYTVTVTDTLTGTTRTYENPPGRPAPAITDTGAFACP